MSLDPTTPVLVGAAAVSQRAARPEDAAEPLALMTEAVLAAAADAGAPALAGEVDVILMPRGMWSYPDPGTLVAAALGATGARTLVADIGVLQQTLLTRACADVAAGRSEVAVVCGGEARHRAVQGARAGVATPETVQPAGTRPAEVLSPAAEILPAVEIERGLAVPAHQYAVMESALRHADGLSVEAHARTLDDRWGRFQAVAATNPVAWDPMPGATLRPSPDNRMIASPYTKRHCSQWNVDQAAALVLCSVETARRHGVPADRWVFPLAAAESNAMVPLSARAALHRCPAAARTAAAALDLAGRRVDEVEHLELYSCFPAAVAIQARELGIGADDGRPLTVTGGMTFAGGPLNNAVLQALVTMVDRLRHHPGSTGLVTSVSGMLTKQGLGLWSTDPLPAGFRAVDVSAETSAATATRPLVDDPHGRATVAGHTVVHDRGRPALAVAILDLPGGGRTVATSDHPDAVNGMVGEDWCGRDVEVQDGLFVT